MFLLMDSPDVPEFVPEHDRTERRIEHRKRFFREMFPVNFFPLVFSAGVDYISIPVRAFHGNFLIRENGEIQNRPHILFHILFSLFHIQFTLLPGLFQGIPDIITES